MCRAEQHQFQVLTKRSERLTGLAPMLPWPKNIWMGVSVELEKYYNRIEDLRSVPAAVRFLSLEPLLGPMNKLPLDGIHWVIVGGESGPSLDLRAIDYRVGCARCATSAWPRACRSSSSSGGAASRRRTAACWTG